MHVLIRKYHAHIGLDLRQSLRRHCWPANSVITIQHKALLCSEGLKKRVKFRVGHHADKEPVYFRGLVSYRYPPADVSNASLYHPASSSVYRGVSGGGAYPIRPCLQDFHVVTHGNAVEPMRIGGNRKMHK